MKIKLHEIKIQIPQSKSFGKVSKYPWDKLDIDECFDVLCDELPNPKYRPDVPVRLKKTGYRIISRKVNDKYSDFQWVIRTWRIN